jgi:uncharacterized protein (TIGR02246 family)
MRYLIMTAVLGLGGLALVLDKARAAEQESAIQAAVNAYTAAFNQRDVDGLLAYFADDADYLDQGGKQHKGKADLAKFFKQSLADLKDQKLKTSITSLRFLRPDVAIADGKAEFTAPDGTSDSGRFTAVWTKAGGKWLLSSVHDLPESPAAPEDRNAQLQQLAWLVGDWTHEDPTFSVQVSGRWTLNKRFLLVEYMAKGKENDDLTVIQYFGWDPVAGVIRAWFFDSEGGYGGGDWVRDGNTWSANWNGVLSGGRVASSVSSLKHVDDKSFIFRSVDREIDGLPIDDIEAKFVRKPVGK